MSNLGLGNLDKFDPINPLITLSVITLSSAIMPYKTFPLPMIPKKMACLNFKTE